MKYYLIITVDCLEGEEGTKLTEITDQELNLVWPLLNYIKNEFSGYFSTGSYYNSEDPNVFDLYSHLLGWKELITRLPEPTSGIKKILEVKVFSENPVILYM